VPKALLLAHDRVEPVGAASLKMFSRVCFLDTSNVGTETPVETVFTFTDTEGQIQDAINAAIVSTASGLGITLVPSDIVQMGQRKSGQLEFLGSLVLAADTNTSASLTIPARDYLIVTVRHVGFDIASILALQFNGDTAANYSARLLSVASGGATVVNNAVINATNGRLFHASTTANRAHFVHIMNRAASSKVGAVTLYMGTASPGITPAIAWGGFEWSNTADQITSIVMLAIDAGSKILAGSGFAVWGGNF
jgi:hypothetical protein